MPNTYKIKATFTDGGEAEMIFEIVQPIETNPKAGDSVMLSIIIGSGSLIGLLGIGFYLKKKKPSII